MILLRGRCLKVAKDRTIRFFKVLLLLGAIAAAACTPDPQSRTYPENLSDVQIGRRVFDRFCRRCHLFQRRGGHQGPDLSRVLERRQEEWVRRFIVNPRSVQAGSAMRAVLLNPRELDGIIAYLRSESAQ